MGSYYPQRPSPWTIQGAQTQNVQSQQIQDNYNPLMSTRRGYTYSQGGPTSSGGWEQSGYRDSAGRLTYGYLPGGVMNQETGQMNREPLLWHGNINSMPSGYVINSLPRNSINPNPNTTRRG